MKLFWVDRYPTIMPVPVLQCLDVPATISSVLYLKGYSRNRTVGLVYSPVRRRGPRRRHGQAVKQGAGGLATAARCSSGRVARGSRGYKGGAW